MKKIVSVGIEVIKTIIVFALASICGLVFRNFGFQEPNIVVVYILAVLITARITSGYYCGIIASIIAILGFNYFFTAPYHTFDVYDPNYFMTFSVMAISALVMSTLTSKEKILMKEAGEKEFESRVLYTLTNQLSDVDTIEKVLQIAANRISELLKQDMACFYFGKNGEYIFLQQRGLQQQYLEWDKTAEIQKILQTVKKEGIAFQGNTYYPICGSDGILGAVKIEKGKKVGKLFYAILENIAIALDRIVATTERMEDRELMMRERYRANLLRAISHDLRTPLSGIMGTSEMLMDMTRKEDRRYELMKGIYEDADWLHALVENILSLTRLQDGNIAVRKELEAIEEVVACAVSHAEKTAIGRDIKVVLPEEFRLVPMDARLMGQVISNLLDNAIKHTQKEDSIEIEVSYEAKVVRIVVRDEGDGIEEKDVPHIFQMFYTTQTQSADAKKGIGLGLAICETVVKAHGGKIEGNNRKEKNGAEFMVEIPLTEDESID